eukprot:scaffold52042_cov22-Tisochrysis_lutea.AAC.1
MVAREPYGRIGKYLEDASKNKLVDQTLPMCLDTPKTQPRRPTGHPCAKNMPSLNPPLFKKMPRPKYIQ